MPKVNVRGVDLHVEQCGQGPAVLCLPGALGTGVTDFHHQLDSWSAQCSVVAPDPRGYGQSRPPDRDFSADFFERDADDMAALMAALGFRSFAVAGWSDGANSAALLAAMHPDRVRKLVIWGGNSFISDEDVQRIEGVRDIAAWSKRVRLMREAVYGDALQELWTAYCDSIQRRYQEGGHICRDRLGMIRCPTLILHGGRDPLVPDFHPHILHQEIRMSELKIFPDGRHHIHLLEEFNHLVLEFLER